MNYVSIVSTCGKWLYCNNVELSVVHWPKGAKDMYMLFLERTITVATTGKTSSKHVTYAQVLIHDFLVAMQSPLDIKSLASAAS